MSDVRAAIVHTTPNTLLLDVGGRQQWVQRESCRHIDDRWATLPRALAAQLGMQAPGAPHGLDVLIEAATIADRIAIEPRPNQPQQDEAFHKLYRYRWFALYMQMRAGKTKVAIDLICNHHALGNIDRVLWLCPNSAKATAAAQWSQFATVDVPRRIVALETISGCSAATFREIEEWFNERCAIVIDESQMIKNDRAVRSCRLQNLLDAAPVKGILSGTPITCNVQDLYNQVRALDWRIFGYRNFYQFSRAHLIMSDRIPGMICDTCNTEYLSERLQPFVYEWFTDYSDRREHERVYIEMSDQQRQLSADIKGEVLGRLMDYREQAADIYLMFSALQSVLSGHVSAQTMRRIFGRHEAVTLHTPKLDKLVEIVAGLDAQKIVWCTRLHDLHGIAARIPDAITVSGEMGADVRHDRIQRFRKSRDGTLVAMVQVAKRAIEMSECNEVIYYSHSFDFESREQSQWRTLLPGKTDICYYTDLLYRGSIDERIQEAHSKKQSVVQAFLDLLKVDRAAAIHALEGM